ncbi:oligopeptidase B Serine peptidase. MEROPS family S09A [Granulicella rosea]|uniref:Oligopeptidase B Serine peptidase. MEROPS family S09A n=1 Tax=Granulicella rosea TaxID=474952 RepID=A0A239EV35_9BACT|nr:S9 family peptidase [Granulicella rosea]SNS48447.1 oligopeptidase B Serine peptidase. MEROPS family S09A [Granulicella rosea]
MITPNQQPPVARRQPNPTRIHGTTLEDDYGWLREKESPETLAYLAAENAYTEAAMAPTTELQATLYREMLSHIKETDESVPYPDSGYLYWSRTVEGSQYPIHCRRRAEAGAPDEILLDVNALAVGQAFMSVGSMSVSPDNRLLAYTTDNTGFRQYTLHIRDLATGADLSDTAFRVGSLAWAADSATLFYTTEDEQTKRQNQLHRHALGSSEPDVLVFEEADERFNLGVGRTRDRQYIFVESGSHTTNEYRFMPSNTPLAQLTLIAPRVDDQEYHPEHRDGVFYIRTNDTTDNFRLVAAPVATPGREHWTEIYKGDVPLEDFDLFASFCVLSERRLGLPTLSVFDLNEKGELANRREIAFPEPTYSAGAHANREFDTRVFRYSYTSLVAPASVYEYDVATGVSKLLKQQEVPGGFDRSQYASERLWIAAADGVQVPVSLVYRTDRFSKDATNALYVYGYGSYGYALPVGFSPTRLSLLDRGVVLAYAHIRGGGELGDAWHDAGKMQVKMNTFTDFVAVTEALVAQGYGSPDRVAIEGGSAGGLLMGAVVNLRPELFQVVLSHVPFVDVMNTMLDATLPLTVAEYEEWGNPNEPEAFATMRAYSPYDNLKAADYPAMLVKTSLNDSQVMYWEPAKYVAKLRTLKQNDTPLLLHINMEAGHGGASGRYDYLKEIAFDYAFLLTELGAAS